MIQKTGPKNGETNNLRTGPKKQIPKHWPKTI